MAKKKEKVNETEVKNKKLSPIIIMVLSLLVIGIAAFGATYLYMMKNAETEEKPVVEIKVPIVEEVTVNLADESGKRYLKTTVYISYNEENKEISEEITQKNIEIQDKTMLFLKSKSSEDFKSGNENNLKNDLTVAINAILTSGEIENVYFPNGLLVQ